MREVTLNETKSEEGDFDNLIEQNASSLCSFTGDFHAPAAVHSLSNDPHDPGETVSLTRSLHHIVTKTPALLPLTLERARQSRDQQDDSAPLDAMWLVHVRPLTAAECPGPPRLLMHEYVAISLEAPRIEEDDTDMFLLSWAAQFRRRCLSMRAHPAGAKGRA